MLIYSNIPWKLSSHIQTAICWLSVCGCTAWNTSSNAHHWTAWDKTKSKYINYHYNCIQMNCSKSDLNPGLKIIIKKPFFPFFFFSTEFKTMSHSDTTAQAEIFRLVVFLWNRRVKNNMTEAGKKKNFTAHTDTQQPWLTQF